MNRGICWTQQPFCQPCSPLEEKMRRIARLMKKGNQNMRGNMKRSTLGSLTFWLSVKKENCSREDICVEKIELQPTWLSNLKACTNFWSETSELPMVACRNSHAVSMILLYSMYKFLIYCLWNTIHEFFEAFFM